jgi:hypothetical protein
MRSLKRLVIPIAFIISIAFFSSSCMPRQHYCASDTLKYQKKSRIKVYKPNSSRKSFVHSGTVRKKYVIKK